MVQVYDSESCFLFFFLSENTLGEKSIHFTASVWGAVVVTQEFENYVFLSMTSKFSVPSFSKRDAIQRPGQEIIFF